MELRFLFWNTNRKECISEITSLVLTNNIDILVLAENTCHPVELLSQLNKGRVSYHPNNPNSICDKLAIYTKFHFDYVEPIFETNRVTARRLSLPTAESINLICLHLGDKSNNNPESQSEAASKTKSIVDKIETDEKHCRSIILGDFNMNPFELGLVKANGFHTTMSHKIARQNFRTVQEESYQYFYNPMWSLFGDLNKEVSGTYYYRRAELVNLGWNIFDQVLFRPELLDNFVKTSLEILTSDGQKSLITKDGLPDKINFSDHLPIKFSLTI